MGQSVETQNIVGRKSRFGVKDSKFTIAPQARGTCGMSDLESTE